MFVGPGYTYLALPSCKSTSTRKWLIERHGARQVGGVHDIGDIPEGSLVWTVVRHPVEWFKALWRRIHQGANRDYLSAYTAFPKRPEDFLRWLMEGDMPPRYHVYTRHSVLLGDARIDMLFKWEHVPEVLTKLPFVHEVVGFAHWNRNTARVPKFTLSPGTVDTLLSWAKDDLLLWERAL